MRVFVLFLRHEPAFVGALAAVRVSGVAESITAVAGDDGFLEAACLCCDMAWLFGCGRSGRGCKWLVDSKGELTWTKLCWGGEDAVQSATRVAETRRRSHGELKATKMAENVAATKERCGLNKCLEVHAGACR